MLQKCVRSGVLFFALLVSIGCSRDGVLENPDSGIRVVTLGAAHGKVGHLVEFVIGNNNDPITDQVVLELHDPEVSRAVLYLSLALTTSASADASVTEVITTLKRATSVFLVPALPEGVKQKGGIILGDKNNPPFWTYLRVTTTEGTLYWSVRGNLFSDRRDWFLTEVRKPPKVIDTRPAQVVAISYYLDEAFTQPLRKEVFIGDTVYTRVEFSKSVPIILANDNRARPHISYSVGSQTFQYRMKPRGGMLASGDAQPQQESNHVFVGMYHVSAHDFRDEFYTSAGNPAVMGGSLRVKAYRYDPNDIPPNTGTTIANWNPTDFVGQVYTVRPNPDITDRSVSVPLPGVTVTIMTGSRAGESIVTDRNGRYRFLNIPGNSLRLRTERRHYEPKEVIVHRSYPATLADGSDPNYWRDPQEQPGNILIGQRWPDAVRFILEGTVLPYDLLYIEYGSADDANGWYGDGFVILYSDSMRTQSFLPTLAHELMHAHQHAIASIDGSEHPFDALSIWRDSPEGRAYAAARAKDWAEVGEVAYDRIPHYRDSLAESAAEIAAYYWGKNRWKPKSRHNNLEETAPNRFKWAAEWLPKK